MLKPKMTMLNLLTFDIEDWYHPNLADKEILSGRSLEDRVEAPTLRIINILEQTCNKATFFVLGDVAEKFPDLVREIQQKGHEVASHGYRHNLVYDYTKSQFETDIGRAMAALSRITNEQIIGYRAPSWSLGKRTPWAWEVLKSYGFLYDSSLYPYKTFLYGDSEASRFDYELELDNGKKFNEIPPSVAEIAGKRLPFSGGFFFRVMPYRLIKMGIKQYNSHAKPANIYLHPWEIDVEQPRLDVDVQKRFILYANLKRTEEKLTKLLSEFKFTSIKDYFGFQTNNKIALNTYDATV